MGGGVKRRPRRRGARAARDSEDRWRVGEHGNEAKARLPDARGGAGVARAGRGAGAISGSAPPGGLQLPTPKEERGLVVGGEAGRAQAGVLGGVPLRGIKKRGSPAATAGGESAVGAGSGGPEGVPAVPRPPAQALPPKPGRQRRAATATRRFPSGWARRARRIRRRRRGGRRRDVRDGSRRRIRVSFPSRRANHPQRASGPHPNRVEGRQGLGADRRDAGRSLGAGGKGSSKCGPIARSRRTARSISPTPCCRTGRSWTRCRARPACCWSRARRFRRTTGAWKTSRSCWRVTGRAAGWFRRGTARCSSRPPFPRAAASRPPTGRSRSTSIATWGKCCGSTPTGRSRTTIRSSAAPARVPRSSRSAFATIRASPSIRARARSGSASTGREAATRSTSWTRARTTASPRSATATIIPASRSTTIGLPHRGWSSRCISGRPTSGLRGLRSTPARCSRRGRAICSSARSPGATSSASCCPATVSSAKSGCSSISSSASAASSRDRMVRSMC